MTDTLTPTAEQGAESPDGEPRRGRGRLLLIALLVTVLVGGAAGWFFVLRDGSEDDAVAEEPADGPVVEVAEMTANLSGPQRHYVRFAFALVLAEGAEPEGLDERFPLLKDAALAEIGGFQVEALLQPEGQQQLRDRLTTRAKDLYPDQEVVRVVLTELLVQ